MSKTRTVIDEASTAVSAAKRDILSMGGKGGVGKTSVMAAIAEWFDENQIAATLLDLDTENKARGSGPHPEGDAPIVGMASWGQGIRGAAGYEDHGESELIVEQVMPKKCRDVMTKDPFCCLAGDAAVYVARLMKDHDVGIVPIVEDQENKKLIGVVTDRDLVLKACAVRSASVFPACNTMGLP